MFDSSTGILTLSGTSSVANYQAALQSVTYNNTSDNPSQLTRTLEFTVNDGLAASNQLSRNIEFTAVNDAPVLSDIETAPAAFTENGDPIVISGNISTSDVDDTLLESASISISGNFTAGEDLLLFSDQSGITGTYNATTGILSLNGSASLADYQAAFRSVQYQNTSDDPSSLDRTITFEINDGDADSNQLTRDISIVQVNDAPTQATIEPAPLVYSENDAPTVISSTISLADLDDTLIESATVTITQNHSPLEDILGFEDSSGITGNFDPANGTLTLSGSASVAEYIAALRSVTYENSSDNPSTLARTVEFTINDGELDSDNLSRTIEINSVNDAPSGENNVVTFLEDTDYTLTTADFGFSDRLDQNNLAGVIINQLPTLGELTLAGSSITPGQFIGAAAITGGDLVFSPEPNANGIAYDRFEFLLVDDGGTAFNGSDTSVSANEIAFDVVNINDAPSGQDNVITTEEDTTYIFSREDFGFSDINDNDEFIAITITTLPEDGSLTIDGAEVTTDAIIDIADIDAGLLAYTPPQDVNGLGFNGLGFQVHDNGGTGNGGEFIDPTVNFINFDLPGVNDPPLLLNEGITVDEGSENIISTDSLSATDADDLLPTELNFTLNTLPSNGELTLNGAPVSVGDSFTLEQIILDQLVYTHDGSETSEDFFDIALSDGGEDNSQPVNGRFTFVINEVIDPPPVIDDESIVLEFGEAFDSLEGDLLVSGTNALASALILENSNLIISIETPPSRGEVTINSDGTFSYQHDGSLILQDSFTYRVTNEDGVFAIATVEVTIEPLFASAFENPNSVIPNEPAVPTPEPEPAESTSEEVPAEEAIDESDFSINISRGVPDSRSESTELDVVIPINEIENIDRVDRIEELLSLTSLDVRQHNELESAEVDIQNINFSTVSVEILTNVRTTTAHDVVSNASFVDALKRLGEDLEDSESFQRNRYQLANDTAIGVSISTTAGVLAWALRGGALFASVMASTPLWNSIDPVRVVGGSRNDDTRDDMEVENYFTDK